MNRNQTRCSDCRPNYLGGPMCQNDDTPSRRMVVLYSHFSSVARSFLQQGYRGTGLPTDGGPQRGRNAPQQRHFHSEAQQQKPPEVSINCPPYGTTRHRIAAELYGPGPYSVREEALRKHLIRRQWVTFQGPDYDRGGTETRYRPPGCR